jgi:hypothetical protein
VVNVRGDGDCFPLAVLVSLGLDDGEVDELLPLFRNSIALIATNPQLRTHLAPDGTWDDRNYYPLVVRPCRCWDDAPNRPACRHRDLQDDFLGKPTGVPPEWLDAWSRAFGRRIAKIRTYMEGFEKQFVEYLLASIKITLRVFGFQRDCAGKDPREGLVLNQRRWGQSEDWGNLLLATGNPECWIANQACATNGNPLDHSACNSARAGDHYIVLRPDGLVGVPEAKRREFTALIKDMSAGYLAQEQAVAPKLWDASEVEFQRLRHIEVGDVLLEPGRQEFLGEDEVDLCVGRIADLLAGKSDVRILASGFSRCLDEYRKHPSPATRERHAALIRDVVTTPAANFQATLHKARPKTPAPPAPTTTTPVPPFIFTSNDNIHFAAWKGQLAEHRLVLVCVDSLGETAAATRWDWIPNAFSAILQMEVEVLWYPTITEHLLQHNGYDCGWFAPRYVYCLAHGLPFCALPELHSFNAQESVMEAFKANEARAICNFMASCNAQGALFTPVARKEKPQLASVGSGAIISIADTPATANHPSPPQQQPGGSNPPEQHTPPCPISTALPEAPKATEPRPLPDSQPYCGHDPRVIACRGHCALECCSACYHTIYSPDPRHHAVLVAGALCAVCEKVAARLCPECWAPFCHGKSCHPKACPGVPVRKRSLPEAPKENKKAMLVPGLSKQMESEAHSTATLSGSLPGWHPDQDEPEQLSQQLDADTPQACPETQVSPVEDCPQDILIALAKVLAGHPGPHCNDLVPLVARALVVEGPERKRKRKESEKKKSLVYPMTWDALLKSLHLGETVLQRRHTIPICVECGSLQLGEMPAECCDKPLQRLEECGAPERIGEILARPGVMELLAPGQADMESHLPGHVQFSQSPYYKACERHFQAPGVMTVFLGVSYDGMGVGKTRNQSVGQVLLTFLGLPRALALAKEFRVTFGVISGPHEVKTLDPLLAHVRDVLDGVVFEFVSNGVKVQVQLSVIILLGDLPALRKETQLGHPTAWAGCLLCQVISSERLNGAPNFDVTHAQITSLRTSVDPNRCTHGSPPSLEEQMARIQATRAQEKGKLDCTFRSHEQDWAWIGTRITQLAADPKAKKYRIKQIRKLTGFSPHPCPGVLKLAGDLAVDAMIHPDIMHACLENVAKALVDGLHSQHRKKKNPKMVAHKAEIQSAGKGKRLRKGNARGKVPKTSRAGRQREPKPKRGAKKGAAMALEDAASGVEFGEEEQEEGGEPEDGAAPPGRANFTFGLSSALHRELQERLRRDHLPPGVQRPSANVCGGVGTPSASEYLTLLAMLPAALHGLLDPELVRAFVLLQTFLDAVRAPTSPEGLLEAEAAIIEMHDWWKAHIGGIPLSLHMLAHMPGLCRRFLGMDLFWLFFAERANADSLHLVHSGNSPAKQIADRTALLNVIEARLPPSPELMKLKYCHQINWHTWIHCPDPLLLSDMESEVMRAMIPDLRLRGRGNPDHLLPAFPTGQTGLSSAFRTWLRKFGGLDVPKDVDWLNPKQLSSFGITQLEFFKTATIRGQTITCAGAERANAHAESRHVLGWWAFHPDQEKRGNADTHPYIGVIQSWVRLCYRGRLHLLGVGQWYKWITLGEQITLQNPFKSDRVFPVGIIQEVVSLARLTSLGAPHTALDEQRAVRRWRPPPYHCPTACPCEDFVRHSNRCRDAPECWHRIAYCFNR